LIPAVTNPNRSQAEQQNISAASFGTYGALTTDGGGFLEGRNTGTLSPVFPKSSFELIIQLFSRLVMDQNVLNIILTPLNGIPSSGYLVITLCGGHFSLASDATVRFSTGSISANARLESNILKIDYSDGVVIPAGMQFSITVTNLQNPSHPQDECFGINAAVSSASGIVSDSTTIGYLPAIYRELPSVWTAGKAATFVVKHESPFFETLLTLSESNELIVFSSERLHVNQSVIRAAINRQGEYSAIIVQIAPGALECQMFVHEWTLNPHVSWLQPFLSTDDFSAISMAPFNGSVSVRWTGFVVSLETVDVTFTVVTSNKFRFWIGKKLLMQRQDSLVPVVHMYASATPMTKYRHENLTVEFDWTQNTESSHLRIQWESAYWSKQDIPTENLWTVVRERGVNPIPIKVCS
jgi:hypothetical protein